MMCCYYFPYLSTIIDELLYCTVAVYFSLYFHLLLQYSMECCTQNISQGDFELNWIEVNWMEEMDGGKQKVSKNKIK